MVHLSVKTVLVDSGYSALLNDQILNTGDIKMLKMLIANKLTWDRVLNKIPRAWMGSESIAHESEGRMDYWLREAMKAREIIIVLVKCN